MKGITRPQSLKEIAADQIRDAIIKGRLKMGEALSENYLAQTLEVSKTPIREALFLLRIEGLVDIVPQRGTFVFSMGKAEIVQFSELRFGLESLAIRFSFERNRQSLLDQMGRLIDQMKKNLDESQMDRYLEIDNAFHNLFFELCENKYIEETYRLINAKIAALRNCTSGTAKATQKSFSDHQTMQLLLKEGQIQKTIELLDQHIVTWVQKMKFYQEQGVSSK